MYVVDFSIDHQETKKLIQKNEFTFLELRDAELIGENTNAIEGVRTLSSATSRFFLYLGSANPSLLFLYGFDRIDTVRWIGLSIDVGSGEAQDAARIYSNIDNNSFINFENHKKSFTNKEKLIPAFHPVKNRYQLGPTIFKFFEKYNLDFAFIDPSSDDPNEMIITLREAFEYLRLRGFRKTLYFLFNSPNNDKWSAKTFNTFSGLKNVHMDLSNKCTHSCVFCGLWGPDFIDALKLQQGGTLTPETKTFMNQQLPVDKALSIIEQIPETVTSVQLGGAGDPLTHPHWLDILSAWRSRGFKTEVLSNFEYPSLIEIEKLHELARGKATLAFFINISASTVETYCQVRPRQSKEVFERVMINLAYAANLKRRDGYGIRMTHLHVINVLNYKEMPQMVEMAGKLMADVWLKPLEIHNEIHKKYAIPKESYADFRDTVAQTVALAKKLNVDLYAQEFLDAIIDDSSLG